MSTTAYFSVMSSFQFEVEQRQYKRALTQLRKGLKLTAAALEEMHAEFGGQPSVPFFNSIGGAIAALFDDQECFALMEEIAQLPIVTRKPDVAQYRRDAELMARVRVLLAKDEPLTVASVKVAAPGVEARRVSRLLNWMQKNGELWVDTSANDRPISRGRTRAQVAPIETFRAGIAPAEAPVVDLSKFSPEVSSPMSESDETDSPQLLSETRTPPSDRLPLSAETLLTSNGTWLVCTAREQPDGSSASTVMRRDKSGDRLPDIVLPFKTLRVRANTHRSYIATVDDALVVRVLDFDGNVLWESSLLGSPEIEADLEGHDGTKPTALLRDFDVDLEKSEFAYCFGHRFYWFNFDGSIIFAGSLPKTTDAEDEVDSEDVVVEQDGIRLTELRMGAPRPTLDLKTALVSRGLPAGSTRRQIAAYLDARGLAPEISPYSTTFHLSFSENEEQGLDDVFDDGGISEIDVLIHAAGYMSTEWCYFLQLIGENLYVCGYDSGLLLKLNRNGDVLASWALDYTPSEIFEWQGRLFLDDSGELIDGAKVSVPDDIVDAPSDTLTFWWREKQVNVQNYVTGEGWAFQVERPIKGVWPTSHGLALLTTTTTANIDIG